MLWSSVRFLLPSWTGSSGELSSPLALKVEFVRDVQIVQALSIKHRFLNMQTFLRMFLVELWWENRWKQASPRVLCEAWMGSYRNRCSSRNGAGNTNAYPGQTPASHNGPARASPKLRQVEPEASIGHWRTQVRGGSWKQQVRASKSETNQVNRRGRGSNDFGMSMCVHFHHVILYVVHLRLFINEENSALKIEEPYLISIESHKMMARQLNSQCNSCNCYVTFDCVWKEFQPVCFKKHRYTREPEQKPVI